MVVLFIERNKFFKGKIILLGFDWDLIERGL